MTRLRLNLVDPSKVDKNTLKILGSAGVMQAGNKYSTNIWNRSRKNKR